MIPLSLYPIFKWYTPVALQEKSVARLIIPLLIGDVSGCVWSVLMPVCAVRAGV